MIPNRQQEILPPKRWFMSSTFVCFHHLYQFKAHPLTWIMQKTFVSWPLVFSWHPEQNWLRIRFRLAMSFKTQPLLQLLLVHQTSCMDVSVLLDLSHLISNTHCFTWLNPTRFKYPSLTTCLVLFQPGTHV